MQLNRTVPFFVLCLLVFPALAQTSTGFYVIIEDQSNCSNLVQNLSDPTRFCLPEKPVITASEFESVSEVQVDKKRKNWYVNLKLTSDGFKILKTLTSRMPNAKLALMVDDKVVGIFDKKGKTLNRTMEITGPASAIDWVYERLKKKGP